MDLVALNHWLHRKVYVSTDLTPMVQRLLDIVIYTKHASFILIPSFLLSYVIYPLLLYITSPERCILSKSAPPPSLISFNRDCQHVINSIASETSL